ncbi:MAG: hypothetical protein R6U02_00655 [Alkalibacterium sp.]|uniref:hypothetical protein n=1 Tax=Alkalibacterium sp. TaxID=1872447 RepID=UPI0039706A3C
MENNKQVKRMLEKNGSKLNIKESIADPIDVVLKLVDIKKCSKEIMPEFYLKPKTEQMYYSIRNIPENIKREDFLLNPSLEFEKKVGIEDIDLNIYEVLINEKSRKYYLSDFEDSYMLFFNNRKVIYIVLDPYLGLADTNSDLFLKEYYYARGITKKDLEEQTFNLWEHLTSFD